MTEIEQEIGRISAMSRAALVERWPEFFDAPVPRNASLEFLRMAIAWKLQARRQPEVVARLQRKLRQMAATMAAGRTPKALAVGPRVRPGTTLVRTWRGKDYAVAVTDAGCLFEGATYASLSEVARKITGTRWNGPSFFGLREPKTQKPARGARDE